MTTSILRSAAALLGATLLAATLGGPAQAQNAECPCLSGAQFDAWFQLQPVSPERLAQDLAIEQQKLTGRTKKLICVDEPGFLTFDYLDRSSEPRRSIYIDLTYANRGKQARCLVDFSHKAKDLAASRKEITAAQIKACRTEMLSSSTWANLGCPRN